LGPVESAVGPLEEGDRVVICSEIGASRRDAQPARLDDRTRRNLRLQALVEPPGVLNGGLGENDRELVASHAARDIRRADDIANALGDLSQHGVSGQVTETVVDLLEIVEIENDQRQTTPVAPSSRNLAGEGLVEVPPVMKARESIEIGLLPRFLEAARV